MFDFLSGRDEINRVVHPSIKKLLPNKKACLLFLAIDEELSIEKAYKAKVSKDPHLLERSLESFLETFPFN
jgi:hypothetical protein